VRRADTGERERRGAVMKSKAWFGAQSRHWTERKRKERCCDEKQSLVQCAEQILDREKGEVLL
jgi:hypothetical protein